MRNITWKHPVAITGVVFLLPLAISAIDRVGSMGSIGPIVFFYSLAMVIFLPFIYCNALLKTTHKALALVVGILCGLVVSVLLLNYFMFVTYIFEIKDYDAM